jgi:hypothetical protein
VLVGPDPLVWLILGHESLNTAFSGIAIPKESDFWTNETVGQTQGWMYQVRV